MKNITKEQEALALKLVDGLECVVTAFNAKYPEADEQVWAYAGSIFLAAALSSLSTREEALAKVADCVDCITHIIERIPEKHFRRSVNAIKDSINSTKD